MTATNRAHLVPCCFVIEGETIYSAIDAKPKSTLALRRVQNIRSNAAVSLLVDHYDEHWDSLWWVRVDGTARTADDAAERGRAMGLLAAKYEQYVAMPPPGPVLAIDIDCWRMWP